MAVQYPVRSADRRDLITFSVLLSRSDRPSVEVGANFEANQP